MFAGYLPQLKHRFRHGAREYVVIILLCTAVVTMYGCKTLSRHEEIDSAQALLTRRIYETGFDDTAPLSVKLEKTGLKAANKAFRIQIEYVERSNTAGDIAPVRSQFLNFYFLAYGFIQEGSFVVVSTQLIVDIWTHDAESETKTCYQWLLVDNDVDDTVDSVDAEAFVENRWNVVKEIQQHPVSSEDLSEYSRLYRRCVGYLLKRMGYLSIKDLYRNL
jgi:hypothetical protein